MSLFMNKIKLLLVVLDVYVYECISIFNIFDSLMFVNKFESNLGKFGSSLACQIFIEFELDSSSY